MAKQKWIKQSGIREYVLYALLNEDWHLTSLPEVATRMYNPTSCRFLPQLLFRERSTVTEQLGSEAVVWRLQQCADLLLEETAAAVATRRLRERLAAVAGSRCAVAGRWVQLRDCGRPRRYVVVNVDEHVVAAKSVQEHRPACNDQPTRCPVFRPTRLRYVICY